MELQLDGHELHRAVAEVASKNLKRLQELFAPTGSVQIEYLEGHPITELLALERRARPELIVVGQTRGKRVREVNETVLGILAGSSVRTLVAFG